MLADRALNVITFLKIYNSIKMLSPGWKYEGSDSADLAKALEENR